MSDLFSKLGALAKQAGVSFPDSSASASTSRGDSVGSMFGSLKDSIPGGMGGLLGAGALGGILGTLMSGKTAKKVASGALVAGGTAAAAALAWTFYQKWQQNSAPQENAPAAPPATPTPYAAPALSAGADPTALLVLTAMVFASRADGYMDPEEEANVHGMMNQLFPGTDMATQMDALLRMPVDPNALARSVSSPEQGRDLYRLSCMVIVADQAMELAYLSALATALGIAPAEKAQLEADVQAMKKQM